MGAHISRFLLFLLFLFLFVFFYFTFIHPYLAEQEIVLGHDLFPYLAEWGEVRNCAVVGTIFPYLAELGEVGNCAVVGTIFLEIALKGILALAFFWGLFFDKQKLELKTF